MTEEQSGLKVLAGDSLYIPAGALQIWVNDDGITGTAASLAIDPWLPDLSISSGTPAEIIEAIVKNGFPLSSICDTESINAVKKNRDIKEMISHPDSPRLKHVAVIDDNTVVGVLDMDKARGQVKHNDQRQKLTVEDIFEPLNDENHVRGDSPLVDYLLTANTRSFRVVELLGGKVATVDVEDLQKIPVRVLLFMSFSYLEVLLARALCLRQPKLTEIVGSDSRHRFWSTRKYRFRT